MTGFPITALATVFGVVTLAVPLAVAWRFRRRPVVAMIALQDRRAAYHQQALTAIDHAIAAARAEGKDAEAARLEPERIVHARNLRGLAAGREFAARR